MQPDARLLGPAGQAVLAKVRAMYARLENPHWMPKPEEWVWVRPDGGAAGFGLIAHVNPGLANLLWLAMDLGSPPWEYDMLRNPAMQLVLTYGAASKLAGEPLVDIAALTTLQEFCDLVGAAPAAGNPLQQAYPLLRLLAAKRLRHA